VAIGFPAIALTPVVETARFESEEPEFVALGSPRRRRERAVVGSSTVLALVVLRLVNAQMYTDPGSIDPWLYTALMTNFDFVYNYFGATYYASRLPAILPGLFLNTLLTPEQAYVVLHLVFFLAGGIFLYLLVRRLFGVRVAVVLYPAILMNAIYVDAHTWDYVDGFVITYLSGGLYFLASCAGTRTRVRPALAGFLFAAAVMTNLTAAPLVLGAIAAYLLVRWMTDHRAALAGAVVNGAWFLAGAGALVVSCGLFAVRHGGQFLFFMPSIEWFKIVNLADYEPPDYGWMLHEPRLLVPGFLAVVVLWAWPRRRRPKGEGEMLGLALTATGTAIVLLVAVWEVVGPGVFLQLSYHYDQLFPYFFVMLAAAVSALFWWAAPERIASLGALAGIGLIVGAVPLAVVFGIGPTDPSGWGCSAIAAAVVATTLLLAAVLRLGSARRLTPTVALVSGALAIGSVGYASAASLSTQITDDDSPAKAADVFSIGLQLMDFMKTNDLENGVLPAFWYDEQDTSLISLHSLYNRFELVSGDMPIPDAELRAGLEKFQARRVVLLCSDPACDGGGAALHHAGYDSVLVAAQRLQSGSKSVWVEAYRLDP
jgi:hypothetical protein